MSVFHWKNDLITNFDAASDWAGDTGPSSGPDAISTNVGVRLEAAAYAADVAEAKSRTLTTLVGFTGADGAYPNGGLIADAAGDLFGTTSGGGADNDGTVFEIAKTRHGYAGAPTTLVSFAGADGAVLYGSLIADAAGDLFGTTFAGGADNDGTVFEIAKTKSGYATTPTTLVSFTGADGAAPDNSLTTDAAGDLFGTTFAGGADDDGTVFEIAKTKSGYATTPTTLAEFNGADGAYPYCSLIADAAGDLFGTTNQGGANDYGSVFELAKTTRGYASAPTTLVSFTGADGAQPVASLIADAAGDLFGTTNQGGADDDGVVFEIAKTKSGYAGTPTILVSFTGFDGSVPGGTLIADAAGDLFGTTNQGEFANDGTVFEIAKTKSGYASAPTILVKFDGANGSNPTAGLIADAAGDLFGTTSEFYENGDGTVFELAKTKGGYTLAPTTAPAMPADHDGAHSSPPGAAFVQAMASHGASRLGSGAPEIAASRNYMPMLLSRPLAAY